MIGEVIAIGDELTSGERLDTNSQWLSQRLTEIGVDVLYHSTVGDQIDANTAVFRAAIDRAEVIVSTGGLGPTADDLTREALAAATGVELVRDGASLTKIRERFLSRGRTMPPQNERQADFPQGAAAIDNPNGTAPGVAMTIDRGSQKPCRLYALPGVPAEMHEMWRATVGSAIAEAQPDPRVIRHRRLKCFGVGESHLEAMLPDLIRRGREPRVGITVSGATITLRVTASGPDESAALTAMAPTLATIREELGVLVFGEEEDELEHAVAGLMEGSQAVIATAESWTEGLLGRWLSAVLPGERLLATVGGQAAVGEQAVGELAEQVRKSADADFGLAVGRPDDGEPPRVAVALATRDSLRTEAVTPLGHPSILRPRIAKHALNLLRLYLLHHEIC